MSDKRIDYYVGLMQTEAVKKRIIKSLLKEIDLVMIEVIREMAKNKRLSKLLEIS